MLSCHPTSSTKTTTFNSERSQSNDEELKPLRRGWYLGSEEFRQKMLEPMDGKLGENHLGQLHRETAEQKANMEDNLFFAPFDPF